MNAPRFVGQMLALCIPGLIAFVPYVQARAPRSERTRPVPTGSVSVWHREVGQYRQSADTLMVLQVRALVERALSLSGPGLDTHRRAQVALSARYGERMLVSSAAVAKYVWVWDPVLERWVIVCLSASTLEIDFGRRGTVLVETREEMPVD